MYPLFTIPFPLIQNSHFSAIFCSNRHGVFRKIVSNFGNPLQAATPPDPPIIRLTAGVFYGGGGCSKRWKFRASPPSPAGVELKKVSEKEQPGFPALSEASDAKSNPGFSPIC
ncbi:hypothetical protein LJC63_00860 [Ruminococcaceae bacterium OttesenSCG-928-L11]|nr:hypothetical protein [Ruminococcaceae bacterium OttesenSCG-928-L11]